EAENPFASGVSHQSIGFGQRERHASVRLQDGDSGGLQTRGADAVDFILFQTIRALIELTRAPFPLEVAKNQVGMVSVNGFPETPLFGAEVSFDLHRSIATTIQLDGNVGFHGLGARSSAGRRD